MHRIVFAVMVACAFVTSSAASVASEARAGRVAVAAAAAMPMPASVRLLREMSMCVLRDARSSHAGTAPAPCIAVRIALSCNAATPGAIARRSNSSAFARALRSGT